MKKYIKVISVFLLSGIFLFFVFSCKKSPKVQLSDLNVLFITLDTLRADHLSCYGYTKIETPNIDRLAANGIKYQNCYAPAPITLPAHCSIFTGNYPITLNVRTNGKYFLSEEEITLAEWFKEKNYFNFAIVSSYVLSSKFGLSQGFDFYDDSLDSGKTQQSFTSSQIIAEKTYQKFKYWFEKRKDQNFFGWVHFYDPHQPYSPPDQFFEGDKNSVIDRYNGEIVYVDHYIGKIVEDLKAAGKFENTLIVIVGDHGEGFGEHMEYGHSIFCYEEAIRVPFIIHNPQILEPKIITQRVSLIDVMPSIIDVFKEEVPENIDGISVLSNVPEDRRIFFESLGGSEEFGWAPLSGFIEGEYKFISLPQSELYDLKNDPLETTNLLKKFSRKVIQKRKQLSEFVKNQTGKSKNTERKLSKEDVTRLKSLGYLSTSPKSAKKESNIDPKTGVVLDFQLNSISKRIAKEEYTETEKDLLNMIKEKPEMKTQMMYSLLIDIYSKTNQDKKMLTIMREALVEFPDFQRFRIELAKQLFVKNEMDEVLEHCRVLIQKDPKDSEAYTLLANTYLKLKNRNKAIDCFKIVSELEPGNISLNMMFANILIQSNRTPEALVIYDRLTQIKEVQENVEFMFWYAKLNIQQKRAKIALEIMNTVIKINKTGNHYFFLALILAENNRFNEAIKTMENAVTNYGSELTPQQSDATQNFMDTWKKNL